MSINITYKRGSGKNIHQKLRTLVSGRARQAAADATADAVLELVDDGFEQRRDPDGRPWAPRKDRLPHPILEKTRAMRTNFFALTNGGQVRLQNTVRYVTHHQTGRGNMPARKVAPDGRLSSRWRTAIDRAVAEALEKS